MGGSSGRIARGDATGSGCLEWLGGRLVEATYHADGLRELVGARFPDDVGLLNHAPTLERLRGDESPRAVLTRFFFLEAAAQSVFALNRGFTAYAREVERWIGFLRRHHVERVVLALLVAERSRRRGVDVVEAFQRSFPLPLFHPPAEHIRRWSV